MFARKFRLPSSVVFANPLFVRENAFLMKYQKNNLLHNRYGIVVSKSVDKRATERNALKRLFRAQAENAAGSGFDTLFIVKPLAKTEKREELISKIQSGLQKVS